MNISDQPQHITCSVYCVVRVRVRVVHYYYSFQFVSCRVSFRTIDTRTAYSYYRRPIGGRFVVYILFNSFWFCVRVHGVASLLYSFFCNIWIYAWHCACICKATRHVEFYFICWMEEGVGLRIQMYDRVYNIWFNRCTRYTVRERSSTSTATRKK